jgi:hypothetical protein
VGNLHIPVNCLTREPLSLGLVDNVSREELLRNGTREELSTNEGWSFAGAVAVPGFRCTGSSAFADAIFELLMDALLSSPQSHYSLAIRSPITFTGLRFAITCVPGPLGQESTEHNYELAWEAGTDTVPPSSQLVYEIYQAATPGGEDYSTPTYTTAAGATELETPPSFSVPYFVVRARDPAGHEDSNTVELRGHNVCL